MSMWRTGGNGYNVTVGLGSRLPTYLLT